MFFMGLYGQRSLEFSSFSLFFLSFSLFFFLFLSIFSSSFFLSIFLFFSTPFLLIKGKDYNVYTWWTNERKETKLTRVLFSLIKVSKKRNVLKIKFKRLVYNPCLIHYSSIQKSEINRNASNVLDAEFSATNVRRKDWSVQHSCFRELHRNTFNQALKGLI